MSLLVLESGEVDERGKILNYFAPLEPNRTDEEPGPKLFAVLAAIARISEPPWDVPRNSNSIFAQCLSIGSVSHDEIEALAEHFFPRIPG